MCHSCAAEFHRHTGSSGWGEAEGGVEWGGVGVLGGELARGGGWRLDAPLDHIQSPPVPILCGPNWDCVVCLDLHLRVTHKNSWRLPQGKGTLLVPPACRKNPEAVPSYAEKSLPIPCPPSHHPSHSHVQQSTDVFLLALTQPLSPTLITLPHLPAGTPPHTHTWSVVWIPASCFRIAPAVWQRDLKSGKGKKNKARTYTSFAKMASSPESSRESPSQSPMSKPWA